MYFVVLSATRKISSCRCRRGFVLITHYPTIPHSLEIWGWTEAQPCSTHNISYSVRGTLAATYGMSNR